MIRIDNQSFNFFEKQNTFQMLEIPLNKHSLILVRPLNDTDTYPDYMDVIKYIRISLRKQTQTFSKVLFPKIKNNTALDTNKILHFTGLSDLKQIDSLNDFSNFKDNNVFECLQVNQFEISENCISIKYPHISDDLPQFICDEPFMFYLLKDDQPIIIGYFDL